MKRILSPVSVGESADAISNFMKLVANEQYGHYWLHQLKLLMRKDPTHVLTKRWLGDLSSEYIWKRAEKHFLETNQLWYNELSWPFQICVLEIGGISYEKLLRKWHDRHRDRYQEVTESIKTIPLLPEREKIFLIRLEARFLGLPSEFKFGEANCPHPKLNLSQCPPETPFFLGLLAKEYFDSDQSTIVAMDFHPTDMVDESKQRIYHFDGSRHLTNGISIGMWDISPNCTDDTKSWWIFQYNLSD